MLIDFEQKFREYLTEYEDQNDIEKDRLEQIAPELYLDWLASPKDWLAGKSPVNYYEDFEPGALIEELGKYILSEISLPGVLLNRIADDKEETYPFLVRLLTGYDGEKADAVKIAIIRLIEEMDLPHPYDYYLEAITESSEQSDLAEACAQELKNSGDAYTQNIIAAFESSENNYVADCLLDILSDIPYDPRTFALAMEKFLYSDTHQAFYASCLGKIGNEKALPFLEEALRSEDVAYYDYVAMKNALEALGGEIDIERDFTGDNDYESLKELRK